MIYIYNIYDIYIYIIGLLRGGSKGRGFPNLP